MSSTVQTSLDEVLAEARRRIPPDVGRRLEEEPLSGVLRAATWGSHEEVESGPLEQALVDGTLRRDVYADLLAQSWAVYVAIEELAPAMADDPTAGPFVRPEVARTAHVERDLAFYWGPAWRDRVDLVAPTQAYVERIRTVAATDPVAWIAHGYTRYLADLSGGLVIDRAITDAYGLEQDGRWLYRFDLPAGVSPATWKAAYRQLLDVLDLEPADAVRLLEEALVAYQCNIRLNDALVERHDPIVDGGP